MIIVLPIILTFTIKNLGEVAEYWIVPLLKIARNSISFLYDMININIPCRNNLTNAKYKYYYLFFSSVYKK